MAILFARRQRRLGRVMIVEDEPLVAFDNERFLSDEGFDVVGTFDCAFDAIALIESGKPVDLVLADIKLAQGSGIDVARAAHSHGIAVLFVTGHCPGDARPFANGCLAKPYAQRNLLAAIEVVESVLAGTRPRRLPVGLNLFNQDAA